MNKLFVSPSPHIYGKETVKKLMYGVLIALIPTLLVSIYFFGLGALILTTSSVVSAIVFEYLITKYILKKENTILDGSAAITGLLLAFNVPSNLPVWIIIVGSFFAIAVSKLSFGGLGNNIFNPAIAARIFMLISFPVQMTSWPKPSAITEKLLPYMDVTTGATPLGIVKEAIRNGVKISEIQGLPDQLQMFLGNMSGSLGEISAIALLIGFAYMLFRKIITWHIPVSIIVTIAIFTEILSLGNPERFTGPIFNILTGGVLLGAIFMATDYVTSPMSKRGMIIYGIGIGMLTVIIRAFGAFPEGVSFAILIMNGLTPMINTYLKPKRFGEKQKI